jgi:hypothetical protein
MQHLFDWLKANAGEVLTAQNHYDASPPGPAAG